MRLPNCFYIILLFIHFTVLSQNTGYMGKKTLVGYGFNFNPVTFGSTASNKSLFGSKQGSSESGHFLLNVTHELFIERALGKGVSLGVAVKYLSTGYDNTASFSSGRPGPTDFYRIRAFTYTPYFKFYKAKYMAPWGKYFIMGPSLTVMRSKHDAFMNNLQTVNNHDTLITDFGSDETKYYSFDLLLGFGRNRIFFDKLSVDYGFNFNCIATLLSLESLSGDGSVLIQSDYIRETIGRRVMAANRFNFYLKLAYLF